MGIKLLVGLPGITSYRNRLLQRICFACFLGLLLPQGASRIDFVNGPVRTRLRGSSATENSQLHASEQSDQDGGQTEAELRARVAELEQRLSERFGESSDSGAAPSEEEPSLLGSAYEAVLKEIPELVDVDNARLGMTDDKNYVFAKSQNTAIYKRKYEVMGMAMTQQELLAKALERAVKRAKVSKAVKELVEIMKGKTGLDKKQVKKEIEKLEKSSKMASIVFRDLIPELDKNPAADAVIGTIASLAIVAMTVIFCFCFFPPVPPSEYSE